MSHRKITLAVAMLIVTGPAFGQVITPGHGTITDQAGNVWLIQPNGSIKEGNTYTPGGGGTQALTIAPNGVYGQDAKTLQWFHLNGTYWTRALPPPGVPTDGLATATDLPIATAAAPISCDASQSGFGIMGGVIYGMDNQPFLPHGVNILYGGQPSASEILGRFPGTNFIRLAVYHYEQDQAFVAYVTDLTSHGLAVLIEDHNNNAGGAGGGRGAIFSGGALSTELAWDAAMGRLFLNNPMVWHASNNEPSMNVVAGNGVYDGGALSRWQFAEYQAFRNTGNNAPFFFELNIFNGGQTGTAIGYDASIYAQTDNSGWDRHVYAGTMSAAQVAHDFTVSVDQARLIKSAGGQTMAIGVFEMGDSMMGQSQDPAWKATLNTVFNSGLGWAAWGWGVGPGDNLTGGGAYEQTVAAAIAAGRQPPQVATGCAAAAKPTTIALSTTDAQQLQQLPPVQAKPEPPPPISVTSQQAIGNARAAMADVQRQMDAIQSQQPDTSAQDLANTASVNQSNAALDAALAAIQAGR